MRAGILLLCLIITGCSHDSILISCDRDMLHAVVRNIPERMVTHVDPWTGEQITHKHLATQESGLVCDQEVK